METITRKCGRCGQVLDLTNYRKDNQTCNICLEKAKVNYANNRDVMIQRCEDYRLNNLEKELERKRLYYSTHKAQHKEYMQEYQRLEYYCPLCLYTVKVYKNNNIVNR